MKKCIIRIHIIGFILKNLNFTGEKRKSAGKRFSKIVLFYIEATKSQSLVRVTYILYSNAWPETKITESTMDTGIGKFKEYFNLFQRLTA